MSNALTLRVSGIPTALASDMFLSLMEAFITANSTTKETGPEKKNILLSSFAPSASSPDRETVRVATITVRDIPLVLRRGGPITLKGFRVFVDLDFFGLTPLNNPTGEIDADIIAVTGLAGHAFGSWKSRGEATMWLRDFLPEYVPTARILTYGYDSTLIGNDSTSTINDFAGRLLETVKTARAHKSERHRPVIFIGHSLGGLVVKQALVKAARGSERDRSIFTSCYGLLFFGVPNRGLSIESLKSMVKGQPNSRLIKDLDPRSTSLRLLHEAFSDYFTLEDSRIISIFETKETRTAVESASEKGVWKRTGPTIMMVSAESATYSGPTEKRYDQLSIDADHSDMTKFSHNQNQDFLTVRQRLIELVEDAPEAIKKRFGPCLPEVRERIKKLLDPTDFETDNAFRSWNHCEGTGNWLLSEPTYVLWEKMLPTEDLWLHGDPGSGKTYLMSKVVERIHQRHKSGAAIAFFFCDNKTESSQRRSTSAVLRTLVSQLLLGILPRHADDVETCLQELAKYGKNDEMMPWLFQEILKTISKHLPRVFLIIDAIDECDDVAELLHVLKDLRTLTTKFHIMISSRGWISSLLSSLAISVHGIVLSLERVKPDIKTFILSKIPCLHIRDIRSEGEVTRRLTDGCDSLFLLAHFYVKSLRRNPPQDLDEALDALPEDLMQFYGKVMNQIQNLPVYQRTRVRKVFMWVIFAKRQLNFGELVGVVYATSRNQQSFQDRGREITQQQLDELCGGLLTFRSGNDPDPSETIIELTHKTVKECVADFVWNTTPPSPSLSDQSACTLEILRMAISYMYNLKTPDRVKNRFLDYVYNFWILHLFDTKTPDRNLAKDVVRFLDSEECYAWWDSPMSAPLNGTADARRNLQSHFQRWVTTNSSLTSRLRRRMYFMTKLQEKQVASYSNLKGKDHLETLAVSGKLGETYRQRGLLKSALKVEKGVWDAYVAVQGADHPQSVIAGNNLANTYAAQGLWSKAEEIHMRRMEACVRLRGRYHLHTLAAATQLARVYKGALQSLRAEVLQFEVVTTSEKILGSNHTNTLQAMGDLAKTYKRQGRFEKSVNLYQEVLAAFKTYRGEDHPETLKAACDLAGAHAICSLKEMIADFAVVDLSDILQIRGLVKIRADNTLALELQEHAVTALKRVLGEFHLETLVASCDLACIHLLRGEWEKATILFEQVLAIREDILGSSHPLSIFSRVQAAAGHLLQGNFVKSVRHASISAAMACNCSINYVPNLRDIHGETLVLKWIQLKVKGVTLSIPDPSTVRAPECGVVVFGENLLDYGVLGFSMGLVLFLSLVCEEVQGLPDVFSVFDRFLV